ncbi:MAG: hypothetical protein WBD40_12950 [Tepidisphaeraceae bacterium]
MAAGEGAGTTSCPECHKRYPWRDNLEGKKVKCKCGNVFEAALDLEGAVEPDDHTYDVSSDDDLFAGAQPAPPMPSATSAPVGSVADAYPQRRSKLLTYAHARPGESEQKRASSPLKDWYLPIGILGLGIAFRVGQVALESGAAGAGTAGLIGAATIGIVLNVVLTLVAVGVSAKLMSIDFGPLPELILKVAATAVLGGALAALTVSIFPKDDMNGPIIALHVVVVLYWILFYMFFEMDLQECLMTVAIVTAFHTAGFCILFKPLG